MQHDAVIRRRNHQHGETNQHQPQRRKLNVLVGCRDLFETRFKGRTESEADQDLNTEDKNAGFVKAFSILSFRLAM